ncbi:MAG: hypothetical protein RLZZ481_832 [Pseudomonadota bacterium]
MVDDYIEFDPNEADYAELRAQDRMLKIHAAQLLRHPSCRDPDHPGCELCEDENEGDEDAE